MARRKQSKRCAADSTVRGVRRVQVGQRDDISTRKKATSTFALTSGEGRADLGSVAPSKATGAAEWQRTRHERAADALLGLQVPAPYRGTTTDPEGGTE
jgi:hypothetical protein